MCARAVAVTQKGRVDACLAPPTSTCRTAALCLIAGLLWPGLAGRKAHTSAGTERRGAASPK
eukprot:3832069-Heterocapsa_arctica.AAC.1